ACTARRGGRRLPERLTVAFTTSSGQTRSSLAEINITPLVDVVLVLLVIFMITAPVLQSGIEVAVPKTKTVKEITEQRTVLTIDRDQQVFLGDKAVNLHQLPQMLRQMGDDSRSAGRHGASGAGIDAGADCGTGNGIDPAASGAGGRHCALRHPRWLLPSQFLGQSGNGRRHPGESCQQFHSP